MARPRWRVGDRCDGWTSHRGIPLRRTPARAGKPRRAAGLAPAPCWRVFHQQSQPVSTTFNSHYKALQAACAGSLRSIVARCGGALSTMIHQRAALVLSELRAPRRWRAASLGRLGKLLAALRGFGATIVCGAALRPQDGQDRGNNTLIPRVFHVRPTLTPPGPHGRSRRCPTTAQRHRQARW